METCKRAFRRATLISYKTLETDVRSRGCIVHVCPSSRGNPPRMQVLGWARKANSQGLQLVPIPSDPFVLPGTLKSDPLRGAIFVPLHVHVLPEPAPQLLKGERKGF